MAEEDGKMSNWILNTGLITLGTGSIIEGIKGGNWWLAIAGLLITFANLILFNI